MFQGRYLARTTALSIFQFCQTIAVYGFTSWVPIILVERGYNVVHSLQYTFLILLLTPIGGLLGAYFAERFERKWQLVLTAIGIGCIWLLVRTFDGYRTNRCQRCAGYTVQ